MSIDFKKLNFFFILGNPRSGTSLLRLMLNTNNDISVPPECGFYHWLSNKYKTQDFSDTALFIESYIEDLKKSKKMETWDIDFNYLRHLIKKTKPATYEQVSLLVYLTYAAKFNKSPKTIGDKNNYYINYLCDLNKINKNPKYIYIVRDCRDVVCSYRALKKIETKSIYKPNLPWDIKNICFSWNKNNINVINFFNKLPKNQYYIIRFEDLIEHTEKILKNICNFLETNYDNNMMEYYKENAQKNIEPIETLDWKKETLNKPNINKIGTYKHNLTMTQIKIIEKVSGEIMKQFHYL
ncbi:MAG: sulfotransferase [Desulfomicrobium sp.]